MKRVITGIAATAIAAALAAQGGAQVLDEGQADDIKQRIKDAVQLIEQMDPQEFVVPVSDQTLYFAISDGGMGNMAKAQASPGRSSGAFMLEATSGAAFIQDFSPTGGPDCDPDAEEPLIIYFGYFADEDASVISVNEAARLGAIVSTGHAVKYRPGPTFCEDETYITDPQQPAFLHVPFSLFGQSPRNFQAMLSEQGGLPVQAMFATAGMSARMTGYSDIRMFGQSSAMSELGAGGAMGQAMLADVLANNPEAAEALSQIPGGVGGIDGTGSVQMDLSTKPMSEIGGNNVAFTYAQIRFAHQGGPITPGDWLEDLQQAIRIEGAVGESEPATPNGGSLED
ncbi:MAG: hypothetical protein KDA56_03360 [Hyphomonas sp.]|jgi:hypothetical protein|nr:hypothetical protein [Hyphomonas sp.]